MAIFKMFFGRKAGRVVFMSLTGAFSFYARSNPSLHYPFYERSVSLFFIKGEKRLKFFSMSFVSANFTTL
jgi:hypothetical protein